MSRLNTIVVASLCLAGAATRVHAEDTEVDVRAFEYLDVLETADGSVWKGVVVEQTPNVQYKIATADGSLHVIKAGDVAKMSKQKNRDYRGAVAAAGPADPRPDGIARHYEDRGPALPAPYASSGLRIAPEVGLVIPTGDIQMTNTSYAPTMRVGYELLLGNVGLGGGGLGRFTYWRLPGGTNDAAWTLETMVYGRAALHVSRVAAYAGVAVGADTNYVYLSQLDASKTTTGFGMNVQSGLEVAVSPTVALVAGFDYHPATDKILDGAPQSISYYSVLLGAGLRL